MFASHNVILPDGTQTAPGLPLVSKCAPLNVALRELNSHYPAGAISGRTVHIADLGSLEGGYAYEFARAGFNVTGIEGRPENHENALKLQAVQAGLNFICGDVREVLPGKKFDVVFCSGLLYHLNEPVAFLNLMAEATRDMLIINTHISDKDADGCHPEAAHHEGSGCDYRLTRHEGRWGHWYRESKTRWDSIGNHDSFWLKKDELMDVLREAGFREVSEIEDWRLFVPPGEHVPGGAGAWGDRCMFKAVK